MLQLLILESGALFTKMVSMRVEHVSRTFVLDGDAKAEDGPDTLY